MVKRARFTEEFELLQRRGVELSQAYAGRYVALVGSEVVGTGDTAEEAYREARRTRPDQEPVIKYFPPADTALVLSSCVWPIPDAFPTRRSSFPASER